MKDVLRDVDMVKPEETHGGFLNRSLHHIREEIHEKFNNSKKTCFNYSENINILQCGNYPEKFIMKMNRSDYFNIKPLNARFRKNYNTTIPASDETEVLVRNFSKRDVNRELSHFQDLIAMKENLDNIDSNLCIDNYFISLRNGIEKVNVKRSSDCSDEDCQDEKVTLVNSTNEHMNSIIQNLIDSVKNNDSISFKQNLNESLDDILRHHENVNVHIMMPNFYTTLLNVVISMRNIDMVSALLEAGADPTISDIGERSAIHYSVKEGSLEILKLLLSCNRTDVSQTGSDGETALHVAVLLNRTDMAEVLLNNGADPYFATNSGQNSLHFASSVDLKLVKLIIDLNDKGINDTDQYGRSALYNSVADNKPDITAYLLEKNAHPDIPDMLGRTPLIISVTQNLDEITELLLRNGVDIYFSKNPLATTPFHLAVMDGKHNIVEIMLNISKDGIDSRNRPGVTPLQMAVSNSDIEMVKMLLDNGANPYTGLFHRKWTVLHVIAERGFAQIGNTVLSRDSSGIDFQNDLGQTALYRSCLKNSTDVFDLLMEYNANTTIPTTSGNTPLIVSAAVGNYHMVDEILNHNKFGIDDQSDSGETPLTAAVTYNQTEILWLILSKGASSYLDTNRRLLALQVATKTGNKAAADLLLKYDRTIINVQDRKGRTALHLAAEDNDSTMLEYFLLRGIDPQITNNEGFTALQVLISNGETDLVDLHLKLNSSSINKQYKEGLTPTHLTILLNNLEIFKILLKHGANAYIPDAESMTPLHYVAFQNLSDFVEHLISIDTSGINMQTNKGLTALHLGFENPFICTVLLNHGANELIGDNSGKTVLHLAVDEGVFETIMLILDMDSPAVNISDQNGQTPLHFAVNDNRTDIFYLLLNASAYPYPVSIGGITPLHFAAKNANKNIVELLLRLDKSFIDQKTYEGNTAMHLAIDNYATDIIRLLLEEGADPRITDYNGATAYHFAVSTGNLEALGLMLQKNISDLNVQSSQGSTLLGMSAYKSQENIFDYLLAKGADYTTIDNRGQNIIHEAAHGKSEIILEKIARKAVHLINKKDFYGMTPIFLTLKSNKLFDILFDNGADPLIQYRGGSFLHIAAYFGNIHMLDRILRKYGDLVDIKNYLGTTPLAYALYGSKKRSVKYFIDNGANLLHTSFFNENYLHFSNQPVDSSIIVDIIFHKVNNTLKGKIPVGFLNQQNAQGLTPISKAAANGKYFIFKTLWEAGSDPYIKTIAEDNILHQAAHGGNKDIIHFVLNHTKIGVNSKNHKGMTPLMKAAESGVEYGFDHLVSLGAFFDVASSHNETLLHFAALSGNANIVRKVLAHPKTNTDAADVEGFTPLMYACIHRNHDAAEVLLQQNADPHVKNIYGETALELTVRQGDFSIMTLFRITSRVTDTLLGSILANPPSDFRVLGDEELIEGLLAHSSLCKNPILAAAAKGDDVQLLKALGKHEVPKKMKIPQIMKQFMKEYDSLIEELLVNEPINLSGSEKYITPLDVALLFFGKASTVKLLIDKLEINLEIVQRSKAMWTPLDFAIFSMARYNKLIGEKERIIHILLDIDKTPIERPNAYGWTVVHKAVWFGNIEVLQYLKKEGYDLQRPDKYGRTPLHIAALKGYSRILEFLVRDSKQSVNKRDVYGFTPLHLVQVYSRRRFFSRLSFAKSDMDAQERYTLVENVDPADMYLGVRTRSYQDSIFALINSGAYINAQDDTFGWTPLHWAAINGDIWKTITLVTNGAEVNLPSRTGVTPLWLARNWGRKVIYHYLKSKGGVW